MSEMYYSKKASAEQQYPISTPQADKGIIERRHEYKKNQNNFCRLMTTKIKSPAEEI